MIKTIKKYFGLFAVLPMLIVALMAYVILNSIKG